MHFQVLTFLTNELFALSWYVSGFAFAIWVIYDVHHLNTSVNRALKAGWPVIIIFFQSWYKQKATSCVCRVDK